MRKIYIKFERHIGVPCEFVYEFEGVENFRAWYREEFSQKSGDYLPADASIDDICDALRGQNRQVTRVSAREAKKYRTF